MKDVLIIIGIFCLLVSLYVKGQHDVIKSIEKNTVDKYHCVPMPEPTTLEEAKKRIKAYQAAIKG